MSKIMIENNAKVENASDRIGTPCSCDSTVHWQPRRDSWLGRSTCTRKVKCTNPGHDSATYLKQVVTAPLPTLGNMRECHGSSEMAIINGCPCQIRCGTLKIPHCSTAMSA